ncbi:alpha/beta fold hydrolase [Tautonia sociabilis]|uniref:alpha/beta fold hydrolase n=1 Tax=Tautonia sociabilis TaxID=2080755 RepID=UPI001F379A0B|nr:alpha/beta hydrolase [Tautonia sociabilis]
MALVAACALTLGISGCASLRRMNINRDLRPCDDGFARTADGWWLGIRHYRPVEPDPDKLPVVLCHGLGLNGTFWTITHDHLPSQLVAQGYEVFVVDLRGSGASYRDGGIGWVNAALRQTVIPEIGNDEWTMDDQALYDVPAILEYVREQTGEERVNWIGHSLGGMLMFAFLERSDQAHRIANFVAMGSPACIADSPEAEKMLRANRGLRMLMKAISTGRIARPMAIVRPPGLEKIDRFYYSADNVDPETVARFYGSTLEDPGPGALRQMDRYLESGRLVSEDGSIDYYEGLSEIHTPTLFVAGDGDILADLHSKWKTYQALGSADKTFLRFGRSQGHVADYGHCDLVWSRHAPKEIFPEVIDWLDRRQKAPLPSPQR